MNKRQRKKLFKKKAGINPPKWLSYTSPAFHCVTNWAWPGYERWKKQFEKKERLKRLEAFTIAMTRRRRDGKRKKNSWR